MLEKTQIGLIVLLLCVHIIILFIIKKQTQNLVCPGYLNLTKGQCSDDGKYYMSFKTRSKECDPVIQDIKKRDTILLAGKLALQYITDSLNEDDDSLERLFQEKQINYYKGIFYFLLKPFLTVLPTNFGQNFITPYGTPSFIADYIKCIPDIKIVCQDLLNSPEYISTCSTYFQELEKFSNPTTPNCNISDPKLYENPLYVELGLLGALSITPSQALLITGVIKKEIGLKYWSFTPYLADRYNASDKCSPYNHIYFSSLTDPFNNFTQYLDNTEFRFALLTTINPNVGEYVNKLLEDTNQFDYIHRFDIPSGKNTMKIQPNLLNPNRLTEEDSVFNYETDRLSILFRMNVENSLSIKFEEFKLNPGFQTYILDFKDTIQSQFYIQTTPLKTCLPLLTNETFLQPTRNEIEIYIMKNILQSTHKTVKIHCFDSLLGTFAPLDKKVYSNMFSYENGLQAIQMASNANGDNPDAWYKISQPQCMSEEDVMVSICVNHTTLRNSMYCNINVLDKQIGRGIYSLEIFDENISTPFYGIVIGRNKNMIEDVKTQIQKRFGQDQILLKEYLIQTGKTMDWNVPMCHQLLFIERSYLNPRVLDKKNELKYYQDALPDTWSQMTRPDGTQLVQPIFIKFSQKTNRVLKIILITIFVFILLYISLYIHKKYNYT